MTAYEMLLSESQERMLIVAHRGREREVVDIFRKWDLDAVVIGRVQEGGHMRVIHDRRDGRGHPRQRAHGRSAASTRDR